MQSRTASKLHSGRRRDGQQCKRPLFSPLEECQNAHMFFEQAWRGRPLTPHSDSRAVVSMMVRVLMMATTSNTEKKTDLSSALCDLSDQHLGTCDWRHPRAFKSLHIQWNFSADTQIGFSRPAAGDLRMMCLLRCGVQELDPGTLKKLAQTSTAPVASGDDV